MSKLYETDLKAKPEFLNYVAEHREENSELTAYYERKDLTTEEKVEVGCYQDVHFWNIQKKDWSIQIPQKWDEKPNCYVINSCCRFPEFCNKLTEEEMEIVKNSIQKIDNAIEKSYVDGERFIYRGVKDDDWLLNPFVGGRFQEQGFGSFSLSHQRAYQYTKSPRRIIFILLLTNKMKALYIDNSEQEILRPRKVIYEILEISEEKLKSNNEIELVYKIKEVGGE